MRNYFISGHNYIQDVVLEAGTYTFWAYIKSNFGNTFTFALANAANEWEVFDVDVQQGQWTKAYEVFTIKEKKVKLSLIYRYFDAEHPVYVLKPQLIKGNIPSDAGASPFDADKITDDLHDAINGIVDFTNEEFADGVISNSERVSLKRDLEAVEVIFQSLKGSFDKLIINPFISADAINDLITKYNEVASAKTVLFGVINGIIDGDGVISQDEIDSKNEKLDALNNAIYEYNMAEKEIANSMGEDYTQKIDEAIVKATYWSVKSSSPVIYKNAPDAIAGGTHTSVTVSGELRSGTTTTQGGFITVTPNGGIEPSTATASPVTISPSDGDAKTSYTVRLYDTASKTTLLDTLTIPVVFKGASGVNAINVILSNEADVLPALPEGIVSDYSGSGTTIRVFEGATELDYDGVGTGNGKFNVTATSTGVTVGTKSENGLMCVFGNASNMTLDNAFITFTISGKTQAGESFSVTKTQSFAKARTGQKGVSVTLVDVEFAKNTSATTPPTTGWTTTAPTLAEGEQLWTRTKTTYSSGNPTYSTPANITPKKGDTGAAGQGIDSVTEEFAISTSKTVQPTSGWSTTQPTWVQGQYIWSRVKVVYKNPSSTVYTGYAVSSEWEAVNALTDRVDNAQLAAEGYMKARYIRDWIQGSTISTNNVWREISVIRKDGTNVAQGKTPSSNGTFNASYPAANATDNNINTYAQINGTTPATSNYVRIDLGQVYNDIDYIQIWHDYTDGRTFYGTKTEISVDGITWTTIYDSATMGTYKETIGGKTHSQRYNRVVSEVNRSKAITDKFGTRVDGGLISTVITEYRELDSPQVTGLISGIQGTNKDLPFLVAGGTYNDALSGTAKAIIRHDGSVKFTEAEIQGQLKSNTSGSGIIIDPSDRSLKLTNNSGGVIAKLSSNLSIPVLVLGDWGGDSSAVHLSDDGLLVSTEGTSESDIKFNKMSVFNSTGSIFEASVPYNNKLVVIMKNLPSSSTGLSTGRLWRDSNGFIRIVL